MSRPKCMDPGIATSVTGMLIRRLSKYKLWISTLIALLHFAGCIGILMLSSPENLIFEIYQVPIDPAGRIGVLVACFMLNSFLFANAFFLVIMPKKKPQCCPGSELFSDVAFLILSFLINHCK